MNPTVIPFLEGPLLTTRYGWCKWLRYIDTSFKKACMLAAIHFLGGITWALSIPQEGRERVHFLVGLGEISVQQKTIGENIPRRQWKVELNWDWNWNHLNVEVEEARQGTNGLQCGGNEIIKGSPEIGDKWAKHLFKLKLKINKTVNLLHNTLYIIKSKVYK